ncbi:conserved hypothetical protein [Vibrio nigripulchritudo MADA3029]|uniref:hypothetical protein n=1 Tax=Vibrio nigripulchritudo TaxID=28173 RepID=UPI0003B1CF94|nr:hypothetical protein [Vibrio nigripulchritudo]CCN46716.1 conserved hypothetical protein [Vibrio nigripulchritudo MADA3020]CCN52003.1 conserved hypothetical protein [Vibrio nigripulchritudo MADA3021]CCN61798.1 conserved hypothetical protein [Vibrio nigripulchritudo MADA3029]
MSKAQQIIGSLSKASPLATPLKLMYGQIVNKNNANETYDALKPILDDMLMRGLRFESKEIQAIIELLRELPAPGARRRNFEKRYLRNESGLRDLPRFASDFSRGFWH